MDFLNTETKMPLSTLVLIAMQVVAMIAYATNLSADIDQTAYEVQRNDSRITTLEVSLQEQQVTLARIDENLKHTMKQVDTLANK
jgi:peptidoglycan hydrolase CwlO-like protein